MAIRKRFKQRDLAIPIAVFCVMLASGVVYAAASGYLTFQGTVSRASNCNLDIESATAPDPSITNIAQQDPTVASSVDSATRETLTFSTTLSYEQTKYIRFNVQNSGNCTMRLNTMDIVQAPNAGITVVWPVSLNNVTIAPGGVSGPHVIAVSWLSDPTAATTVTASAQISYEEVTGP